MSAVRKIVPLAVSKPALLTTIATQLAPFAPVEIANAIGCVPRAAKNWRLAVNLPQAEELSRLRAWLPGLQQALLALEQPDRLAAQAMTEQFGPAARHQEGD